MLSATSKQIGNILLSFAVLISSVSLAQNLPKPDGASNGDGGLGILRQAPIDISDAFIKLLGATRHGTNIPLKLFDDVSLVARTVRVEETDFGFSWIGVTPTKGVGDVILSVVDGSLVGSVWLDTATYSIHGDGKGGYVVDEIDPRTLEPGHGSDVAYDRQPVQTIPLKQFNNQEFVTRMLTRDARYDRVHKRLVHLVTAGVLPDHMLSVIPEPGSRVDVLIAYTAKAKDWMEQKGYNPEATISNLIAKANTALYESLVSTQLNLVDIVFVDYDEVDPTLESDINNLTGDNQLIHEDLQVLHTRRDDVRADIVSLLVYHPRVEESFNGRGRQLKDIADSDQTTPPDGKGPFDENGFNVVNIEYAVKRNTFTHEIGHNFGAGHDRFQHQQEVEEYLPLFTRPPIPGGHGFYPPESNVRTVMAYNAFCAEIYPWSYCPQIPRFSNSQQSYLGIPAPPLGIAVGQPHAADNATVMNLTARTVANFRHAYVSPPP